jgi:choline dehydrogenase-like flavoprotein
MSTGNLDIVTQAMVREVEIDKRGLATGVVFVDKESGKEYRAKARVIVLAASACETVRIMLNSKSTRFPHGLANSSGKVGKYLMDTVGSPVTGQIPLLEDLPPQNEDGAGGLHVYSPWWLYKEQHAGKLDFARGYHIEMGTGRRMPSVGNMAGLSSFAGGYGRKFKEDMRRYYGSFIGLSGRGEMIPNEDSYCEIDPKEKDRWGIPTLRFHWKWSDHETRQAAHMQKTFAAIIEEMGGKVIGKSELDGRKAIAPGGFIIHEIGGAIMGSDPKKSVTNQWMQSWDVKNLFITDGAPFPSNADKNPTLTIMALAWRSADYMLQAMKRREL